MYVVFFVFCTVLVLSHAYYGKMLTRPSSKLGIQQRWTTLRAAKQKLGSEWNNERFTSHSRTSLQQIQEGTGDGGRDPDEEQNPVLRYFLPGFVGLWAVGYSLLAAYETTVEGGLGDAGGFIGAGFAVVLLLGLLGVTMYEVFKP
jgi:hypothetical protein